MGNVDFKPICDKVRIKLNEVAPGWASNLMDLPPVRNQILTVDLQATRRFRRDIMLTQRNEQLNP
jgi:hypothetical protein